VNKSHLTTDRSNATASAYITFANKEDALSCIIAVDGFYLDGSLLRCVFYAPQAPVRRIDSYVPCIY
jgi:CCR4-NOT transcription complex subunit 4